MAKSNSPLAAHIAASTDYDWVNFLQERLGITPERFIGADFELRFAKGGVARLDFSVILTHEDLEVLPRHYRHAYNG